MDSLVLFFLAIIGLIASKKFLGDYFSPPAIYNAFWAGALGLLQWHWVSFDPLRAEVWQVILLSYASFMAGCALIGVYMLRRPDVLKAPPQLLHLDRKRFEKALGVLLLLGVFGFLIQLGHLQATIGLGTFLADPQAAREAHSNVKYLGFFNILNVANFVLACMYVVLYKRPHPFVLLILVWALATTFMTTDRTRFFYMIIWSFYACIYLLRKVKLTPKMVAAAALTGLSLLGFFLLVAKIYVKQAYEDNQEFIQVSETYAPLVDPYIYLTGSFPVLQAMMSEKRDLALGKNTFEPIVKVIEAVDPHFEREELVGKFYRVPVELNVCTYLEPYYRDFGVIGTILGPFFTGLLVMAVYASMRRRKTLFNAYLAGICGFCLTISIFVNHFTQVATWYFVIVGYLVHRYSYRLKPDSPEAIRRFILE